MNKALRILSETKTDYNYTIRHEIWQSMLIEATPLTNNANEVSDELQNLINSEPKEIEITTCYTNDGFWIGDENTARQLCEVLGINPMPSKGVEVGELRPCNHGWCKKEQKWYGWSHRAIYGFGIGSEVKKGDCAYVPMNMEDARQDAIRFWSDDSHLDVQAFEEIDENGESFFRLSWRYSDNPKIIPNEKLRGTIGGVSSYPPKQFGHGEWVAKTLNDAKQMAIDFAGGVS